MCVYDRVRKGMCVYEYRFEYESKDMGKRMGKEMSKGIMRKRSKNRGGTNSNINIIFVGLMTAMLLSDGYSGNIISIMHHIILHTIILKLEY